jgi:hypothetical protein
MSAQLHGCSTGAGSHGQNGLRATRWGGWLRSRVHETQLLDAVHKVGSVEHCMQAARLLCMIQGTLPLHCTVRNNQPKAWDLGQGTCLGCPVPCFWHAAKGCQGRMRAVQGLECCSAWQDGQKAVLRSGLSSRRPQSNAYILSDSERSLNCCSTKHGVRDSVNVTLSPLNSYALYRVAP